MGKLICATRMPHLPSRLTRRDAVRTWSGVYSKPVLLEDGRTVIADENYIRESIVNPTRKDRKWIQTDHAGVSGTGE